MRCWLGGEQTLIDTEESLLGFIQFSLIDKQERQDEVDSILFFSYPFISNLFF